MERPVTRHETTAEAYRTSGKEAVWQRKIITLATLYGWASYHTHYALGSDKGYPDLTLIRPGFDPLWIEVKGPKGKISAEQIAWLATINDTRSGLAIVAWPQDLEAVGELLAGRPVDLYEDGPVLRVRLIGSGE